MNKKGLIVDIYCNSYASKFNVINKFCKVKEVLLLDAKGPFEPNEEHPAVKLVKRNIRGEIYIHAEPEEPGSYAFGGNFIYSSDNRFRELNAYPIPLHDRQMNLER